jgi:hypothetical protein
MASYKERWNSSQAHKVPSRNLSQEDLLNPIDAGDISKPGHRSVRWDEFAHFKLPSYPIYEDYSAQARSVYDKAGENGERINKEVASLPSKEITLGDDGGSTLEYRRPLSVASSKRRRFWKSGIFPVVLIILTIGVFVFTLLYSGIPKVQLRLGKHFVKSASDTIFAFRILSEVNAILLAALICLAFEYAQWSLVSRPEGTSLFTFLSLDYGSALLSLVRLLKSSRRGRSHLVWVALRYVNICRMILERF